MSIQQDFQWRELLDTAGIQFDKPVSQAPAASMFPYKNRISEIGTTGAGKSTNVAGLVMTAESVVARTKYTDTPFYCRVLENTSDIHQDVSNLRDGHFPAKTAAYNEFASEAGLLLEWERNVEATVLGRKIKKRLWHKMLQVPICDIAGEDLSQVIRQVRMQGTLGAIARRSVKQLINYVRESDGYIITIKASRAKGLGIQLETEKDKKLSTDPDVNLVRMLEDLMNYKAHNPNRPIKGVAVVITAWDKLKPVADKVGFDILDPHMGQTDLERFVLACFPSTYAAIQSLRVPNVQYFPSFFEVETDEKGDPLMSDEPGFENTPKIKMKDLHDPSGEWWQNVRKISYSEKQYYDLLNWLKNFAMTG